MAGERGLTLLEVVIALLLFAMLCVLLLSGHQEASQATLRASVARDMAYLLPFRLQMVALEPELYEDGENGGFPHDSGTSLIEEDEIFGEEYAGYRWEVEIHEVLAGGTGGVTVDGSDPMDALFPQEGGAVTAEPDSLRAPEEEERTAAEVDRMYRIQVTIYPPNYDPYEDPEDRLVEPQSAWTAVPVPEDREPLR